MGLAGQLSWEHELSLSREAREEFNQESGKEGARGKEKKKSASMSHKFTSDTGRCASRKRKRRFGGSERMKLVQKERSTEYGKKKSKAVVERVNGDFLRSLVSEGSNNMMGCAGVETAVEALSEASCVTRDSCFVDFGCSAGGICLYMAQRYGCKVYGIDRTVLVCVWHVKQLSVMVFHNCALFWRLTLLIVTSTVCRGFIVLEQHMCWHITRCFRCEHAEYCLTRWQGDHLTWLCAAVR